MLADVQQFTPYNDNFTFQVIASFPDLRTARLEEQRHIVRARDDGHNPYNTADGHPPYCPRWRYMRDKGLLPSKH
jgi:hypothetical protein